MPSNEKIINNKFYFRKILQVFAWFIAVLMGFFIIFLVAIRTNYVQDIARKEIVTYLNNKLNTKVEVQGLSVDFPKTIVLEGIYIEDLTKDTLIYGELVQLNVSMFALLNNELNISELNLEGITTKINRLEADTLFNFQFIIDAFGSDQLQEEKDTSGTMKIVVDNIFIKDSRIVFKDIVTGNDVDVFCKSSEIKMKKIDPANMVFDIPSISIDGLNGRFIQRIPIAIKAKDDAIENTTNDVLSVSNQNTSLKNIDLRYINEVSALDTRLKLQSADMYPDQISLDQRFIKIKGINLDCLDISISIDSNENSKRIDLETKIEVDQVINELPWKVEIEEIRMKDNKVVFDDNTKPILSKGLDMSHLSFSQLNFEAKRFLFHSDTIALNITKASVAERSGLIINELQSSVFYTDKGATLKNLLLKTPRSEIKKNIQVSYPSLAQAMNDYAVINLDADIENSKILVADILALVPTLSSQPAFKNPKDVFHIDAKIDGNLAQLNIRKFLFRGFNNTRINVNGVITNVLDTNKVFASLNINNVSTSSIDIKTFTTADMLPQDINLPKYMSLSGNIKGGINNIQANLNLRTSLGNATIDGMIRAPRSSTSANYSAVVSFSSLQAGKIIGQEDQLGNISAQMNITGIGYDPVLAKADINATINSVSYNNYNYQNIIFKANLDHQKIKTSGFIKDPNIHLSFMGEGQLNNNTPSLIIKAQIDSIKTGPLNLTSDPMIYRGIVTADFPVLSLDSLQGQTYITQSLIIANNRKILLDSILLEAKYLNGQQSLFVKADFGNMSINGRYKLAQLGNIFMNSIAPYYKIDSDTTALLATDYDFKLGGVISDHPVIRVFLPDLTKMSDITVDGSFKPTKWNFSSTMPSIFYGTNKVSNLTFSAIESDGDLKLKLDAAEIKNGENINLINTRFYTEVNPQHINYNLRIGDQSDVDRYIVKGTILREPDDIYDLSIETESLMLNYEQWEISKDNSLRLGTNILVANSFELSNDDQHLRISNTDSSYKSPLKVQFDNFKLGTFTGFLQQDSLIIDGTINGDILVKDIATQPNINADLSIKNFAINRDTIGDLVALVDNNTQNTFDASVSLKGRNNEALIAGKYYMMPEGKSEMDINIDIKKLQMSTIEGLSQGAMRDGKGLVSGNVLLKGKTSAPNIDGNIGFNDASMIIAQLNNKFKIDNEQILAVNNVGLKFDRFTVRDEANNRLTIDGSALTTNYVNYKFDLAVTASNFQGLNSSRIDNKIYYGKLFFDTKLNISGTEMLPVVDGTLRINEDTDLTIVLPQERQGLQDREGIVVFVDKDAPANDSLFLRSIDTLNKTLILGMDVSVNIEVDKKATLTMVIDEANGDFIKLKGDAQLNGGVDKSGKITLTGSYELEEGAYEMSFNLIKRKFIIQKGSKITWAGEPTDGTMDVTAIYTANTNAADLVQDQVAAASTDLRYRQKLPFEVQLNMDGPLLKPQLTFGIKLKKETSVRVDSEISGQVEMRLNQINAEPSELSKQVYALLILNRFVAENPFASVSGGFNAESMARQSLSKILSQQLNNLAANLVTGVELDFDVVSSEDYTSGNLENRTDLNVGVSKRLLNDRLNVTVGTNIALEGSQKTNQASSAGNSTSPNINIEYMLSQDGRYLLRGYRKNEFEGVVEGFVVETGVGFVMSIEYDKFKEIFQRKKERKAFRNAEKQRDIDKNSTDKVDESNISSPSKNEKN